jgi:hypothetical protein
MIRTGRYSQRKGDSLEPDEQAGEGACDRMRRRFRYYAPIAFEVFIFLS